MLRPLAPEGVSCGVLSPDGRLAACESPRQGGLLYPVGGGEPRAIPGLRAGEESPLAFSSDGRSLFVGPAGPSWSGLSARQGGPLRVVRLDLTTGKRELWHEFVPPDRAGLQSPLYNLAITPDGSAYAYSFLNTPSDLYLVTGLK